MPAVTAVLTEAVTVPTALTEVMVVTAQLKYVGFLILLTLFQAGCSSQNENSTKAPEAFSARRYGKITSAEYRGFELQHGFFIQGQINQSQLEDFKFKNMKMNGTKITQSRIINSSFVESELAGLIFLETKLESTSFKNSNLTATKFLQSHLYNVDFSGADLRDAVFLLCTFHNVHFNKATRLPFSKETAVAIGLQYVE